MAPMLQATLLLAAGFVSQVAAHGFYRSFTADGKTCPGYNPNYHVAPTCMYKIPTDTDNGFIDHTGYGSRDIICHKGAVSDDLTLTVQAGHTLEGQFSDWPESHHGPTIQSLANCNGDCRNADLTSLNFNVIAHNGLIHGIPGVPDGQFVSNTAAGYWALDEFREGGSKLGFPVPSWLAPGNYIYRSEFIALHSAMKEGSGAQHYPQCLNIVVTGSGTDPLNGGSSPMTWYNQADPGITLNIFRNPTSYVIPGPDVYVNGQGGGKSNPAPNPTTTTAAGPSSTSASPTTPGSATGTSTTSPKQMDNNVETSDNNDDGWAQIFDKKKTRRHARDTGVAA